MLNRKSRVTLAIVVFFLSFIITLQVKTVFNNQQTQQLQYQRIEDIQKELTKEKERAIDLENQLLQASNDLVLYRKEAEESGSYSKALSGEIERYKILAGLTDVEGKGITVTLNDSDVKLDPSQDPSSYILHDTDLRTVVNELNSAGAEAISINGERLVSTSEIRCVGPTIIVNGNKYTPPYVIKAIGDPDMLEAALNIKGGIVEELKLWNLEVGIVKSTKLKIGKYNGIVNFKYAENSEEVQNAG